MKSGTLNGARSRPRGRRADRQRHGDDGAGRERRRLAERAERVTDIAGHVSMLAEPRTSNPDMITCNSAIASIPLANGAGTAR
jgi:hypothetical protein